jgi:hypothetical protein
MVRITQKDSQIRYIGEVKEENGKKVFIMKRDINKHFMFSFYAWGIDLATFQKYKDEVEIWRIIEKNSQNVYEISSKQIENKGFIREFGSHLPQIFIPLKYWSLKIKGQKELFETIKSGSCKYE